MSRFAIRPQKYRGNTFLRQYSMIYGTTNYVFRVAINICNQSSLLMNENEMNFSVIHCVTGAFVAYKNTQYYAHCAPVGWRREIGIRQQCSHTKITALFSKLNFNNLRSPSHLFNDKSLQFHNKFHATVSVCKNSPIIQIAIIDQVESFDRSTQYVVPRKNLRIHFFVSYSNFRLTCSND